MFYIVYSTQENPLMTMGDAVASFLDEKDVATKDSGLQSLKDIKKGYSVGVRTWSVQRRRWRDATSRKRRFVTLTLYSSHTPHLRSSADTKSGLVSLWDL